MCRYRGPGGHVIGIIWDLYQVASSSAGGSVVGDAGLRDCSAVCPWDGATSLEEKVTSCGANLLRVL